MTIHKSRDITLEELVERIDSAGHGEIDAIIDALQSRYKRLFPDWEVAFLSVPRKNRLEQAQLLIDFIQKHYLDA